MENRFGLRDLVVTVLLVLILVSIWLAMKQYDRQWKHMVAMHKAMEDQTSELRQLNERLGAGFRATLDQQTQALARVEAKLAQGVTVTEGGPVVAGDPGQTPAVAPVEGEVPAPLDAKRAAELTGTFDRMLAARALPGFAEGDWMVDAFGQTVGKLTPLTSSDVYQSMIEAYVLESLADRDPDTLEWRPMIAKSWTISEDGLVITFDLRDDVRFSDGTPLTADDIVFTYEWIMNPRIAAPRTRAYYEKVRTVVKESDFRVRFELSEPYFKGFDVCAGMAVMAKHFYGQFTPEQFNEHTGLLFGSGPYRLSIDPKNWRPGGGQIELVRNHRYWGVPPAFNRIVFREILDETARLVAFRNGEVDRYAPVPEQYVALKDDKELLAKKDMYEYETVTGGYRYVAWNQKRNGKPTPFADKRVRQALTMVTPRQEMVEKLMVGLATVNSGPFHRLGKQSDPEIEPWPYDVSRARALLEEAGFTYKNRVAHTPAGEPFRFKLIYPASSVNYQQMATWLKDAYARVGIILEPDPLEWTIMLQRIDQRDFDAMTLGWSGTIEGDPYQIFHSNQVADGGDNYTQYVNTDLDKLIDDARVTMDEDERMKLWRQVHRILHEDQPYTFLWSMRSVVLVDKRIRNIQRVRLGLNPTVEWFVPGTMQIRK